VPCVLLLLSHYVKPGWVPPVERMYGLLTYFVLHVRLIHVLCTACAPYVLCTACTMYALLIYLVLHLHVLSEMQPVRLCM